MLPMGWSVLVHSHSPASGALPAGLRGIQTQTQYKGFWSIRDYSFNDKMEFHLQQRYVVENFTNDNCNTNDSTIKEPVYFGTKPHPTTFLYSLEIRDPLWHSPQIGAEIQFMNKFLFYTDSQMTKDPEQQMHFLPEKRHKKSRSLLYR
jgi:hypothetical protein